MNFLLENYLIFVLIGLFLIFALIGYIVDLIRKNNNNNDINKANDIPAQVNNLEENISLNNIENGKNATNINSKAEPIKSVNVTNINESNNDDLLNSYNNE